ncbi:MAG: tetratricopeptide repeat protein [Candidatus Hydrogenedentes bacterium]|nr:tetratricopeptide repeat protein [Candidatus Hydrogenedentota bacterium]
MAALDVLAHLLVLNGKWQRAMPLYRALVALDPRNLRWRQALAYTLLRLGRSDEALAQLDWCLAQRDEVPSEQFVLLRARVLWDLARKKEAMEFLAHPERAAGSSW